MHRILIVLKADVTADDAGLGDFTEGELEDDDDGENHKDRDQNDAGQQPEIGLPLMPVQR
jgi:hypothetical protein